MSEISITLDDLIAMQPCNERLDVNRDRFAPVPNVKQKECV